MSVSSIHMDGLLLAENLESESVKTVRDLFDGYSEVWKNHVEEVRIFEAECLKTEKRLKLSHSKLQTLTDHIRALSDRAHMSIGIQHHNVNNPVNSKND